MVDKVETYNKENQFPSYMPMYTCVNCGQRRFKTMATNAYLKVCGKCFREIRDAKFRGGDLY